MSHDDKASNYDPEINWKTLAGYVLAIGQFVGVRQPVLSEASFLKIAAMSDRDLPRAQHMELETCGLGYRHYASPKSRQTLVLVHGSGGYGDQMHAMARAVARRGVAQVYTVSMRGHGLSDGRPGHAAQSERDMVDDLSAFITHLRRSGQAQRVVVGGHSAGGGLVLGLARAAPEVANGYLFLAPFLGLGSPVIRRCFGGWVSIRPLRLALVTLANLLGIKRFNNTTVVAFDEKACSRELRLVAKWSFNTLLAFGPGRWIPNAPPLPADKPVLLAAGRSDECFHQPLYRQAFETVAPHAQIVEVGGGHWDLLVEPEAINAIAVWLDQQNEARKAPVNKPKHQMRSPRAA